MAWAEKTDSTVTLGKWADWTASWNNGTDQWGASNMTQNNHRWTKVGGIVYAHGSLAFTSASNFGTGTGTWTLWFPSEWGSFVNTQTGGRIIGDGWAAGSTRALHFHITMINTFDGFAVPIVVQNIGGPGQNFNAGADTYYPLNRDKLTWISNGSSVSMHYSLRFITNPNT
jgi:hypothetical protein